MSVQLISVNEKNNIILKTIGESSVNLLEFDKNTGVATGIAISQAIADIITGRIQTLFSVIPTIDRSNSVLGTMIQSLIGVSVLDSIGVTVTTPVVGSTVTFTVGGLGGTEYIFIDIHHSLSGLFPSLSAIRSIQSDVQVTSFTGLTDTPDSYVGQAGKIVAVKGTADGLEFIINAQSFTGLTDTPDSYTGQGNKGLRVNGAANAIEFYDSSLLVTTLNQTTPVTTISITGLSGLAHGGYLLKGQLNITQSFFRLQLLLNGAATTWTQQILGHTTTITYGGVGSGSDINFTGFGDANPCKIIFESSINVMNGLTNIITLGTLLQDPFVTPFKNGSFYANQRGGASDITSINITTSAGDIPMTGYFEVYRRK